MRAREDWQLDDIVLASGILICNAAMLTMSIYMILKPRLLRKTFETCGDFC